MAERSIETLLEEMASFRRSVEPGVAYGIKMVFAAKDSLRIDDLRKANLCVIAETSRCLPDAIQLLTGCTVGNGRLIIKNHGKMAATFIDLSAKKAVRVMISPQFQKRDVVHSKEFVKLKVERKMEEVARGRLQDTLETMKIPNEELLRVQEVELTEPINIIPLPTGIVFCEKCGESVREGNVRIKDGKTLCLTCAGIEKPYFKLKYGV